MTEALKTAIIEELKKEVQRTYDYQEGRIAGFIHHINSLKEAMREAIHRPLEKYKSSCVEADMVKILKTALDKKEEAK